MEKSEIEKRESSALILLIKEHVYLLSFLKLVYSRYIFDYARFKAIAGYQHAFVLALSGCIYTDLGLGHGNG